MQPMQIFSSLKQMLMEMRLTDSYNRQIMKSIHFALIRAFLLLLIFSYVPDLLSQPDLKPVEDETTALLSELGGAKNKVKRATLTKEDEGW